ncbi:MAG: SIMPL domain-containing protein [Patescibacteria group bacterium]
MDPQKLKFILWLPTILGFSLVLGLWLHGMQIASTRATNIITVTGSAKKIVMADLAKWSSSFQREANLANLPAAIQAIKTDSENIKRFLISFGLQERSITFLPIQTEPFYQSLEEFGAKFGYSQPRIAGYFVTRGLRVESEDIEKIEQLSQNVNALAKDGILFQYNSSEYHYTKLNELRPELYAEATKDALIRAQAIARGTGVKIGKLHSARTGVIQILSPHSTNIEDYGAYDLSTKEKEITATTHVSFVLH